MKADPVKHAARGLVWFCLVLSLFVPPVVSYAQQPDKTRQFQQYVYVLRLTPRMQDAKAWTDVENKVIGQHFSHLKQAAEAGKVMLAGRTTESLDKTFGLVIFEAESAEAARVFMESDPAIVANIMTSTLHPYAVALQRKP